MLSLIRVCVKLLKVWICEGKRDDHFTDFVYQQQCQCSFFHEGKIQFDSLKSFS